MKDKLPMQIPENIQKKMLGPKVTNDFILEKIKIDEPFLVSKFGGIEAQIVDSIILKRNQDIDDKLRFQAKIMAGIIPPTLKTIRTVAAELLCAGFKADLLAIWNYSGQTKVANFVSSPKYTYLNNINPLHLYDKQDWYPWTIGLEGFRVLTIHPFVITIDDQLQKLTYIQTVSQLWPGNYNFQLYKPAVTLGGENQSLKWVDELARMKREIAKIEFDIALIGAGAYGMPLGGFIRDIGKKAIHLGGSLQLLFGIIGARWEGMEHYAKMMGSGWVRPSEDEIPRLHHRVDKSAYW